MATSSSTSSFNDNFPSTGDAETAFQSYYSEVKEIEKRDSVLTSKQQIDRLLRPGSTYFNLNPFEVLHVDPETPLEDLKKQYRRLSILVHPDKNQDDPDRAQKAFEIVNKAYKILENETLRQKCLDVIEEAKARTEMMIQEKKRKLKKENKKTTVEEDDPAKMKHAIYVMTMKLFADMERKRRDQEQRDTQERKRKREEEINTEEKAKLENEWQKNFEESREGRVSSWQDFQKDTKAKKSKKFSKTGFKPPKHKAETR